MASVYVSLEEILALRIGAIAPNGSRVTSHYSTWSTSCVGEVQVIADAGWDQYIYRFLMPDLSSLPMVIDPSQDGFLALTDSWYLDRKVIAPVLSSRNGHMAIAGGNAFGSYYLLPGVVPRDSVSVLGPPPAWYESLNVLRDTLREAALFGLRTVDAPDLAGRVNWLLWLFGLDESDRSGDMPCDRENAWMLDLIHPSPDDNRLLFCPSRPNDVVRKPVYSRISTVLKTLQRKIGLQLPWTIEELSYAWSEVVPSSFTAHTFELVSGKDIKRLYDDSGGPESCMVDRPYTCWYGDNPDTVQLLVIRKTSDPKTYGRALVWTTTEGQKVLDRIYPTDGGAIERAGRKYAEEQGWDFVWGSETPHRVTMKPSRHGYPYMDTFIYADKYRIEQGETMTLSNHRSNDMRYMIRRTDGGIERTSLCTIRWSGQRWGADAEFDRLQAEPVSTCFCGRTVPHSRMYTTRCGIRVCSLACYQSHANSCLPCEMVIYPDRFMVCTGCDETIRVSPDGLCIECALDAVFATEPEEEVSWDEAVFWRDVSMWDNGR